MHNYHSVVPSHEKRIVVGSLRNLNLTLMFTAEQKIWTFQYHDKKFTKTSRDRPKSAPYPRLKNSKKTSKCQSILFYGTGKPKSWTEFAHQRGHFEILHPFCRKSRKKIEGGALLVSKFFEKSLTMPKKNWKGGPLGIFQHPFCRKTPKKWKGDPLGIFFRKKSLRAENILKEYPLVHLSFLDDVKILLKVF